MRAASWPVVGVVPPATPIPLAGDTMRGAMVAAIFRRAEPPFPPGAGDLRAAFVPPRRRLLGPLGVG